MTLILVDPVNQRVIADDLSSYEEAITRNSKFIMLSPTRYEFGSGRVNDEMCMVHYALNGLTTEKELSDVTNPWFADLVDGEIRFSRIVARQMKDECHYDIVPYIASNIIVDGDGACEFLRVAELLRKNHIHSDQAVQVFHDLWLTDSRTGVTPNYHALEVRDGKLILRELDSRGANYLLTDALVAHTASAMLIEE